MSDSYGGNIFENYERYFVPSIGAPLAQDLIAAAVLIPGERVLDVACGTGVAARLASRQVGDSGTVAGLDVNPGMLAVAASAAPEMSIEWLEGSAEAIPEPNAAFDAVLCQMGLQFFADKPVALREMYRVLSPGGRLVLSVPGPTPRPFAIMAEALARHLGPQPARFVQQVFSLHDTAELENLICAAGFREVSSRADIKQLRLPAPKDFLWQYVHSTPLAGAANQMDDERRASLELDIVEQWQQFVEDGALMLQVRMAVAIARK